MKAKIYQVATNMECGIYEIEYIRKTDTYFWTSEKNREMLNTKYSKSFETKEEAIYYLKYLIRSKIDTMKSSLEYYENKLNEVTKEFE